MRKTLALGGNKTQAPLTPCAESLEEHRGSTDPVRRGGGPGGPGWKRGARGVAIGQANGGRQVEEHKCKDVDGERVPLSGDQPGSQSQGQRISAGLLSTPALLLGSQARSGEGPFLCSSFCSLLTLTNALSALLCCRLWGCSNVPNSPWWGPKPGSQSHHWFHPPDSGWQRGFFQSNVTAEFYAVFPSRGNVCQWLL